MQKLKPILQMRGIKKSFYSVPVLKGISLDLYPGECVSLIGENGAGKSTLVKILSGVHKKDEGQIIIDGTEVNIEKTDDAKKLGIRVIYQELSLFPTLTVTENMFINDEIAYTKQNYNLAPLNTKKMKKEAIAVLNNILSVNIDVNQKVEDLTFSQKQMVEISRAVYSDDRIIIMDEPTTALENKEKEILFRIIEGLKARGKTIIFISHHLDEIFRICDRMIVLRDGNVVLEEETKNANEDILINAMIGKSVTNYYPKEQMELGDTLFSVEGLTSEKFFHDISFDLKKKEVLGIVGLVGCGKNEIIRSLFGIIPYDKGEIKLDGKKVKNSSVSEAVNNKLAFLPAERKVQGIFPMQDVNWNVSISFLDKVRSWFGVDKKKENEITGRYVKNFNIKVNSNKQLITRLSGGNQQKVMLSRWFLTDPKVLLLEEPTRGIDVNAKTDVYKMIMQYVSNDNGVIIVSSEDEEVLGICDRIVVIHNKRIAKILDAKEASLEAIKRYSSQIDAGTEV